MPMEIYMYFQGATNGCVDIVGEAQDESLRKTGLSPIRIKSFGLNVENKTTIGSGSSGASSGKAVLSNFTISKISDSCTTDFYLGCCRGGHYDKAVIMLRKDTGAKSRSTYIQYTFSMVFVTKVDWKGDEDSDAPSEDIEFAYGALKIEYFPQSAKGGMKAEPKIAAWNQVNNSEADTVVDY